MGDLCGANALVIADEGQGGIGGERLAELDFDALREDDIGQHHVEGAGLDGVLDEGDHASFGLLLWEEGVAWSIGCLESEDRVIRDAISTQDDAFSYQNPRYAGSLCDESRAHCTVSNLTHLHIQPQTQPWLEDFPYEKF